MTDRSSEEVNPFPVHRINGCHFMEVSEGTKVTDERSGTSVEIRGTTLAIKGHVVWCTKETIQSIKAALEKCGINTPQRMAHVMSHYESIQGLLRKSPR